MQTFGPDINQIIDSTGILLCLTTSPDQYNGSDISDIGLMSKLNIVKDERQCQLSDRYLGEVIYGCIWPSILYIFPSSHSH